MKVKLTRREPDAEQREQGHQWLDWCGVHDETPEAESGWRTMHDAAPDDATRALMELVDEVVTVREDGVDPKNLFETLDRLRATPEGAALIRQAMDRDDG